MLQAEDRLDMGRESSAWDNRALPEETQMQKIAFIGLGIMGVRQAANLLKAGYPVTGHARTPAKAASLVEKGAKLAATPAEAAKDADVVITMVGAPKDVEAVYFPHVLDAAKPGALLVDMTTSSPKLAERIAQAAKTKGLRAIDAPVTGGESGAAEGTLTILCGGEQADFDAALPVLSKMGTNVVRFGGPGSGQRAKAVNQIIVQQNVLAAMEGLFFAKRAGLDGELILKTLQTGTADSKALRVQAAKAMRGDFTPGFYPVHALKDLEIAIEESDALGMDLKGLKNMRDRWKALLSKYPDAKAIQDLARLYL
jgi:3-hydroxyisobutyrate dehydrogenase